MKFLTELAKLFEANSHIRQNAEELCNELEYDYDLNSNQRAGYKNPICFELEKHGEFFQIMMTLGSKMPEVHAYIDANNGDMYAANHDGSIGKKSSYNICDNWNEVLAVHDWHGDYLVM